MFCSGAILRRRGLPFVVCVSSLVVDEIRRIVKSSEIMKYRPQNLPAQPELTMVQGRRLQVATEKQRRATRAGDKDRERSYFVRGTKASALSHAWRT